MMGINEYIRQQLRQRGWHFGYHPGDIERYSIVDHVGHVMARGRTKYMAWTIAKNRRDFHMRSLDAERQRLAVWNALVATAPPGAQAADAESDGAE